jgi:hypothetical protein
LKELAVRFFDYETTAREANIPTTKLEQLRHLVREEFPKDEMMYELHLLRVCMAIKSGVVTLEEALKPEPASKA